MTYVITNACVDVQDQKCVGQCPVDCIYLAQRAAYIHPDECIDCGACLPVCPVKAILPQEDLQPHQMQFLLRQEQLFRNIGSPGGAAGFGRLPADHPDVASLPRAANATK